MTLEEALEAVGHNDWRLNDDDEWECPDEMVDGVPDWVVCDQGGYGWVSREIGWYYQRADWDGYADLVRVAAAMNAADVGLQAVLREEP